MLPFTSTPSAARFRRQRVHAGAAPPTGVIVRSRPRPDLPTPFSYGPVAAPSLRGAETLRTSKPRVLYILLGETDEWAHQGRYDLYLDAGYRTDGFIRRVWDTLQSLPDYRNTTTLLVTTDHGRGATPADWGDHGKKVPAAESTWILALGPGVPALGVRESVTVTTSQFAATIAAVVGEDFRRAAPNAAPALPLVSRSQTLNLSLKVRFLRASLVRSAACAIYCTRRSTIAIGCALGAICGAAFAGAVTTS